MLGVEVVRGDLEDPAGLAEGRRMTSWWAMRTDLENAGATFVDAPVVVDRGVITSRGPIDLAACTMAVIEALQEMPANAVTK